MRSAWSSFLLIVAVVLSAGTLVPARAHSTSFVPVPDPHGMFTISFPADWKVGSVDMNGRVPRGQGSMLDQPQIATIVGEARDHAGDYPARIVVMAKKLDKPLSSGAVQREFYMTLDEGETATVLQEGPARVGGNEAHYRYQTIHETEGIDVYSVTVYITSGRLGFLLWGTVKQDRTGTELPLILRIMETFRPARTTARLVAPGLLHALTAAAPSLL